MNKTRLVLAKELRVMIRDRRLVVTMVLLSVFVMPFLMGLIGNIDRLTGADEVLVPVLLQGEAQRLTQVLSAEPTLVFYEDPAAIAALGLPFATVAGEPNGYLILGDGTDGNVRAATVRIKALLESWRAERVAERLRASGLDPAVLEPFTITTIDTADARQQTGLLLSLLVPYIVIILLVSNATRAIYVAVGEKDHNTLAALLVANVPRPAIVLGKTLAITLFAVVSSLLLVAGLLLFANLGFFVGTAEMELSYTLSALQVLELALVLGALSLFVAALIMLLGTYARNSREAGVYTTPLVFIAIFLAVFSFSSTDFGTATYAFPILGNALAMRDTFLDQLTLSRLLVVLSGNAFLFTALLAATTRMYERETVLFRE